MVSDKTIVFLLVIAIVLSVVSIAVTLTLNVNDLQSTKAKAWGGDMGAGTIGLIVYPQAQDSQEVWWYGE